MYRISSNVWSFSIDWMRGSLRLGWSGSEKRSVIESSWWKFTTTTHAGGRRAHTVLQAMRGSLQSHTSVPKRDLNLPDTCQIGSTE